MPWVSLLHWTSHLANNIGSMARTICSRLIWYLGKLTPNISCVGGYGCCLSPLRPYQSFWIPPFRSGTEMLRLQVGSVIENMIYMQLLYPSGLLHNFNTISWWWSPLLGHFWFYCQSCLASMLAIVVPSVAVTIPLISSTSPVFLSLGLL